MACKVINFNSFNKINNMKNLIDNFENELKVFQKAEKTVSKYIYFLNRFISDNNINLENINQLQEYSFYTNFIEGLQHRGNKNSTINQRLNTLNVFCNYLVRMKLLNVNIISAIPKLHEGKSEVSYLENDEVQMVLFAMKERIELDYKRKIDRVNAFREYVMVSLMITLGIRVAECCNVRMCDINMNAGTIAIRGKGYRGEVSRVLDIPESVIDMMHEWEYLREEIDIDCASDEFYFVSALTKKNVKVLSIEKRLKLIGEELGIGRIHPHKFRHSFATNNLHDGSLKLSEVSEILGHSNEIVTAKYYVATNKESLKKTRYSGSQYEF